LSKQKEGRASQLEEEKVGPKFSPPPKDASAAFKRLGRAKLEDIEGFNQRDDRKRFYNIRDEVVKKKPLSKVKYDTPFTQRLEPVPEGNLCTKGISRTCRHSNQRVISKIDKLSEILHIHKVADEKREKEQSRKDLAMRYNSSKNKTSQMNLPTSPSQLGQDRILPSGSQASIIGRSKDRSSSQQFTEDEAHQRPTKGALYEEQL